MPAALMQHDEDPADVIFKKIGMKKPGELPGFRLFGNRILVGIYERPEVTKSGIHLPDKTRDEEKYQGKAAVVLMKGHSAFKSDDNFNFGSDDLQIGDWVTLSVTDGRAITINKTSCRIVRDQDIVMKIPAPDQVW